MFYRQAASHPCPPSPISSPTFDRGKGDFVPRSPDQEITRGDMTASEFQRKVERLNVLTSARSYKIKEESSEVDDQQKQHKIRRVLDKIIFTPNRALNHNLQLIRKKLSIYLHLDLRKPPNIAPANKLASGDQAQIGVNEKFRYKWDHSRSFTFH